MRRPRRSAATVGFALRGQIERTDIEAIAACVAERIAAHDGELLLCDVSEAAPDAVTVDALARIALLARRRRCALVLRGLTPELRSLLELVALESELGAG